MFPISILHPLKTVLKYTFRNHENPDNRVFDDLVKIHGSRPPQNWSRRLCRFTVSKSIFADNASRIRT